MTIPIGIYHRDAFWLNSLPRGYLGQVGQCATNLAFSGNVIKAVPEVDAEISRSFGGGTGEDQKTILDRGHTAYPTSTNVYKKNLVVFRLPKTHLQDGYQIAPRYRAAETKIQNTVTDRQAFYIDPVFLAGDFAESFEEVIFLEKIKKRGAFWLLS